jgi:hypothetical protein
MVKSPYRSANAEHTEQGKSKYFQTYITLVIGLRNRQENTMFTINLTDDLKMQFDVTNPNVGMPDGQLVLTGPSMDQLVLPFKLVGDGKLPTDKELLTKVNSGLAEQNWNVQVKTLRKPV